MEVFTGNVMLPSAQYDSLKDTVRDPICSTSAGLDAEGQDEFCGRGTVTVSKPQPATSEQRLEIEESAPNAVWFEEGMSQCRAIDAFATDLPFRSQVKSMPREKKSMEDNGNLTSPQALLTGLIKGAS